LSRKLLVSSKRGEEAEVLPSPIEVG